MDKNISVEYVDLSYRNLVDADLCNANLSGADIRGADLHYANLSHANLSGANMRYSDLFYANLSHANLSNANLRDADLCTANLSGANLRDADLSGANLAGVNLTGANLTGTIGLGSKAEEVQFAISLLEILRVKPYSLNMESWHNENKYGRTHDIAGFYAPDSEHPGAEASRALPTLAKYFHSSDNFVAMQALERVARGEESVF